MLLYCDAADWPETCSFPAAVLDSSQFEDFEAFMAAAQALWDKQWAEVYSAPRHGAQRIID